MNWLAAHLDELAEANDWPYQPGSSGAVEPAALAALALAGHGHDAGAERARRWLLGRQAPDGSLGIDNRHATPHWPTALATLAWRCAPPKPEDLAAEYTAAMGRATAAILASAGKTHPQPADMGHDTTLVGWTWADGTHSWQEPTAMCVLALKATGAGDHPRAREGVRLLVDRLLPDGGCNYGNTSVLGQTLKPHLEPTGVTLLALAGESDPSGRLERSIAYARETAPSCRAAASLAWGLLGLAAHGQLPQSAGDWLAESYELTRRGAFLPRRTLLALAALGERCPLVSFVRRC